LGGVLLDASERKNMTEEDLTMEELKALDKEVKKLKRISSEWAAQLHDLVEERLPAAYEEIHGISQSTYEACRAWAEANARLISAQKQG
jgi:hypothetical protein